MSSSRDDDDDRVYLTPNGPDEKRSLEAKFAKICNGYERSNVQVRCNSSSPHRSLGILVFFYVLS